MAARVPQNFDNHVVIPMGLVKVALPIFIGVICSGVGLFMVKSIAGLCLIGTGGRFTRKQLETALDVTEHWIRQFRIIVDNVIGHYEIGQILPDYATTKRCPEIDMSVIRDSLHSRQAVAARATG